MRVQNITSHSRLSLGQRRAVVAIAELLDRDPKSRETALTAFEKTVLKGRPDLGAIFLGTLELRLQQQVREVCAPHFVVLG